MGVKTQANLSLSELVFRVFWIFSSLHCLFENQHMSFGGSEDEFLIYKGVWKLKKVFQISWKQKAEIPEGV